MNRPEAKAIDNEEILSRDISKLSLAEQISLRGSTLKKAVLHFLIEENSNYNQGKGGYI